MSRSFRVNFNKLVNALYKGEELDEQRLANIIGLYRIEVLSNDELIETMKGKPIYLGLAMNGARKFIMKPQNLLTNLPIKRD